MKNFSYKHVKYIKLFHIFLTDGVGGCKSRLIEAIFISISKLVPFKGGDPEKPRILILAPTGVAAIDIEY